MEELPSNVLRVFLCNRAGVQIVGNVERHADKLISTVRAGAKWMWRGFFREALKLYVSGQQSGVTGAYRDMITKKRFFTYFTTIGGDKFLFLDVIRMPLSVGSFADD
jgi:hypothetical protein